MRDYPKTLIDDYRRGAMNREKFEQLFGAWQKNHGINFACKGSADRNGTYLTYRGVPAEIKNGVLCWGKNRAKTIFIFERQIDHALNAEAQAIYNACYFTDKAYDASRNNDYNKRNEYKCKADYFIKQAEKWSALWN